MAREEGGRRKRKGRGNMSKGIQIYCSNCGKHEEVVTAGDVKRAIQSGWNSYGRVLYCPECVRTWRERNGDKELAGEYNTAICIVYLQEK